MRRPDNAVDKAGDNEELNMLQSVQSVEPKTAPRVGQVEAVCRPTFDEIFTSHKNGVYRMALAMTGNGDDAAELCQEVFLRIHKNLDGFRGDSSVKTWVLNIARNTTLSFLSKRKIRSTVDIDLEQDAPSLQSKEVDATLALNTKESRDSLITACAKLPMNQQEVVSLFYFQGMTTKELAAHLDCSEGKIKVTLYRARKALYKCLKTDT